MTRTDHLLSPDHPPAVDVAADLVDYFVFALRGRIYALPPGSVELVAPSQAIVPIPTVPAHVRGVIHLRGRITAVVDLAAVIAVDEPAADDRTGNRLVLMSGGHPYAFVADATLGLWPVAPEAVVRRPDDDGFVLGRIEGTDRAATVLDPAALVERMLRTREVGR